MTVKLFVALYAGLLIGMFVLFFTNFWVGWIFFAFTFVAVFGGLRLVNRPGLIAAGFLLVSLLVMGIGLFGMYQSWQVGGWPTAWGSITRSWFCTRTVNGKTVYSGPCIDYSYSVNGQSFQVSSIDTRELEGQMWLNIPDKFKQGREVPVYYRPDSPGVSRLTAEALSRDWVTALVGGIMTLLSVATLVQVMRPHKEPPAALLLHPNEPEQSTQAAENAIPAPHDQAVIPDIADQLERLAVLRDSGKITGAEYDQAKKRLLGMSPRGVAMPDSMQTSLVDVVLLQTGAKSTDVVLALREIAAKESLISLIDLATAKRLIDNTPSVVVPNVPVDVGQRVKARLERAGAGVELKSC